MDWTGPPWASFKRRSRHSGYTQCHCPDKSEPRFLLLAVRHGRFRRIPCGPHWSPTSSYFHEHHPGPRVARHGHSIIYTLPDRICWLSARNLGPHLLIQDSLLARYHTRGCLVPRRSSLLRDEGQSLCILRALRQRCRLTESIRMAYCILSHPLENVHHLDVLVLLPSSGNVSSDPRN